MNDSLNQYLAWKIQVNDNYIDLAEVNKKYFIFDNISKIKDLCPTYFNILESAEILKAYSIIFNKLKNDNFIDFSKLFERLYKIYEKLLEFNNKSLAVIDIKFNIQKNEIVAILVTKDETNKLIFTDFNIIYLLFLTDAYKII